MIVCKCNRAQCRQASVAHPMLWMHGGHFGGWWMQACSVDPGSVATAIYRDSKLFSRQPLKWLIQKLYAPPWDGAAAVVHAASARSWGPPARSSGTLCCYTLPALCCLCQVLVCIVSLATQRRGSQGPCSQRALSRGPPPLQGCGCIKLALCSLLFARKYLHHWILCNPQHCLWPDLPDSKQ